MVAQNKHRHWKEQPIFGYRYSNRHKVGFYGVCEMSHFKNAKFTVPGVTLAGSSLSLYSPKLVSFEKIENRALYKWHCSQIQHRTF